MPEYANQVKHIPDDEKGPGAETACGGRVKINGDINLTGKIDGAPHTVKFKDMNATMPIASMIQTVKKGNGASRWRAPRLPIGRVDMSFDCTRDKASTSSTCRCCCPGF